MAFGTVFRNFSSALRAHGFIFRDGRRMLGVKAINKSGSSIAANKLVALSGYDVTSKHMKIVLADADVANLATEVFVTRAAISNNAMGTIYKGFTSTSNLDTSGVAAAGDPLFLDITAGAFTATAPTAGNARVQIVGYAQTKSASVGQVAWDIQAPQKLGSADFNIVSGRSAGAVAAVASVATLTPAADGSFDVQMNVLVTTATTHTFTGQCTYTDEGNTARTVTMPFRLVGDTTALTSSITNTNGTVPYEGVALRIRVKGGTAITLLTQAAGTYTTVVYNVEGTIRQVA